MGWRGDVLCEKRRSSRVRAGRLLRSPSREFPCRRRRTGAYSTSGRRPQTPHARLQSSCAPRPLPVLRRHRRLRSSLNPLLPGPPRAGPSVPRTCEAASVPHGARAPHPEGRSLCSCSARSRRPSTVMLATTRSRPEWRITCPCRARRTHRPGARERRAGDSYRSPPPPEGFKSPERLVAETISWSEHRRLFRFQPHHPPSRPQCGLAKRRARAVKRRLGSTPTAQFIHTPLAHPGRAASYNCVEVQLLHRPLKPESSIVKW